jgi:hypothetical protein
MMEWYLTWSHDNQHNKSQCNGTQHNYKNVTFSITLLDLYADCYNGVWQLSYNGLNCHTQLYNNQHKDQAMLC